LGYDSRIEHQRYFKLARLARYNEQILGPDWASILKNLQSMAKIMGVSFIMDAQARVPRTPHGAWYSRHSSGYAKCKHCNTIVLKDGGCDHMSCPSCSKDYEFEECKIPTHKMDVGTIYLATERKGKGRLRPKLCLSPVMEDVETDCSDDEVEEDNEDGHGDTFGKDVSFSAGDSEASAGEVDEASVSETRNISLWEDDLISCIYDDISTVSVGEDKSWSVVSPALQPEESLSSFSVVSGIGSVYSLDEFDDLTCYAPDGAVGLLPPPLSVSYCDVVEKPNRTRAVSYCDIVKKSAPTLATAAATIKAPRRSGAVVGIAGSIPAKEQPPSEEYYNDNDISLSDDAKYDGRGGKMYLRYRGGHSPTGNHYDHRHHFNRGSQLTRKQRKARTNLRKREKFEGKGRPGQRCGFRNTKSDARQYYGIKDY